MPDPRPLISAEVISPMPTPQGPPFIVAVTSFVGDENVIVVHNGAGAPLPVVYCIARQNDITGVLEFVDYGYGSIEEAREAWPRAE